MLWTPSAPPQQSAGFEVTEPLCLSTPSREAPGLSCREPSLLVPPGRRDEGAVRGSELGHCHHLPSSSQAASPCPWYPRRVPGPILPSCPRSSKSLGRPTVQTQTPPPPCQCLGFVGRAAGANFPILSGNQRAFSPFTETEIKIINTLLTGDLLRRGLGPALQDVGVPAAAALVSPAPALGQCPPCHRSPCHPRASEVLGLDLPPLCLHLCRSLHLLFPPLDLCLDRRSFSSPAPSQGTSALRPHPW